MGRHRRSRRQRSPNEINPGHTQLRSVLRVIGPGLLIVGILLVVSGSTMDTEPKTAFFGNAPKHMEEKRELRGKQQAAMIPGFICIMVGLMTTVFAFQGAFARYHAAEYAPVVADTANYVARGAKQGIREVSGAIADGLRGEREGVECPQCGTRNDGDARFCDNCGAAMSTDVECGACGEENDADAKFCKSCGKPLGTST